MRTTPDTALPIRVRRGEGPLPDQIVAEIRRLLAAGVLTAGDPLPSTRALATRAGVSRGSVVAAYEQLLAEGWLVAHGGRGTRVNPKVRAVRPPAADLRPEHPPATCSAPTLIDLRPGRPMESSLVDATWRSAWRRAADEPLDVPVPTLGCDPLRHAIAEHLRRMRAVVRSPDRIAVTAGGREGLALLLGALGVRRVGVEEPGYPSLRQVVARAGAELVTLATDRDGLITDLLPDRAPDLVLVTPSHQYPLGGSLPIDRRQALLEWADRHGVWVVEDDYDSELRYTSQPLPALTAMDERERVVLLGTFAKTLSPALATGFLVLPGPLIGPVAAERTARGMPVSLVTQRAVGHYLTAGGLTRHTQRMRHLYRRRRALVVTGLEGLPGAAVRPMDGGLHAVVDCVGTGLTEPELLARLADAGVLVTGLSAYWSTTESPPGIVFGFGAIADEELARGLAVIADVLRGG
ncbi:PLP-dependent aminotransferase family protein [Granulicoccus sp. GXG6511]|uniref:MocR-like pyridoxine biosynthesis transcription factor PdxR n=1 Tax=Granulicoccus sp. GXG6511 TaxID=3381351 RepID=UPI003D7EE0AD